ncbi:hypothetical protein [Amycolatopsis nigrescens]|uniref:hypothetical protein n=1 Tax=Amycolatopsis nigrescens TaxID=381445 RepID=UPI00037AECF3|nr:hypothetical protein [Amycolatopsis nigrescens]
MSFFEDEPPRPEPEPVPPAELYALSGPHWFQAPELHFVPAILPWPKVLARAERTVVALRGVLVWPEAATFVLTLHSRDAAMTSPSRQMFEHDRAPESDEFRFGVQFADGNRATGTTALFNRPATEPPAEPVLRTSGSSGSQHFLRQNVFLWPLPPDGPCTLVVRWTAREIPETRTEVDGAAIRAAAAEALEIWPDLPVHPGHQRTTVVTHTSSASGGTSATFRRQDQR